MAADHVATSVHSHPSGLSLNEMDTEDQGLQGKKNLAVVVEVVTAVVKL